MRVLGILLSLLCGIATVGANIIVNGDFAEINKHKAEKWYKQDWRKPPGTISFPNGVEGEKSRSLAITNSSKKSYTVVVQSFKLKSNKKYTLSFYVKSENIQGDNKNSGGIVYLENNKTVMFGIGVAPYKYAQGSFDWKRVEYKFRTKVLPVSKARILLALKSASGTVMFDNITLKESASATERKDFFKASIYPLYLQDNVFHLCRDFPAALLLDIKLDRRLMPGNFLQLVMDVPQWLDYLGSGTLLPDRIKNGRGVYEVDQFKTKQVNYGGQKYIRYTITLNKAYTQKLGKTRRWENYNRIYLRSSAAAGRAGKVFWKIVNRSKVLSADSFHVKILPKLNMPSKPAKKFQLCIARLWNLNTPGDIGDSYINYWKGLQERPWTTEPYFMHGFSPELKKKIYDNFKFSHLLWSTYSTPWFKPLLNALPVGWHSKKEKQLNFPLAIGADGKPVKEPSVSPWYLIEDPENIIWGKMFDEYAATIKSNPHIRAVSIDYEPHAMGHCFSKENVERFCRFAKLVKTPSIANILSRYRKRWFEFRVEQHRLIIKKMGEKFREKLPGVQFWLCSDQLHPEGQRVSEWCGVNVEASDQDVDVQQIMPYFSGLRFFKTMKLNIEALKKPCFPYIDPSENNPAFYHNYTPRAVMQNILVVAALGGYGIGFWPCDVFDGRYLEAIKEGFRVVAKVEDFYAQKALASGKFSAKCRNVVRFDSIGANGKKVSFCLPQLDKKIRVLCHRLGNSFVLTVFNFSNQDSAIIELNVYSAKGAYYQVRELVRQVSLVDKGHLLTGQQIRDGFLVEVPAGGSAVLKLTPESRNMAVNGVDQAELNGKLNRILSQYKKCSKVKPYRDPQSAIAWALTGGDEKPVVMLEKKGICLGVAADSGDIVLWQPDGKAGDDLLYNKKRRGWLGKLIFNTVGQKYDNQYELVKFSCEKGNPGVEFFKCILSRDDASGIVNPLAGLTIEKKIVLMGKGKRCQVTYKFVNIGKQNIKFSFRSNNYPCFYDKLTKLTVTCGNTIFSPGIPHREVVFLKSPDAAPELMDTCRLQNKLCRPVVLGPVVMNASFGVLKRSLTITPDKKTVGFYSWGTMERNGTIEPVSPMLMLAPGKSMCWTCDYTL